MQTLRFHQVETPRVNREGGHQSERFNFSASPRSDLQHGKMTRLLILSASFIISLPAPIIPAVGTEGVLADILSFTDTARCFHSERLRTPLIFRLPLEQKDCTSRHTWGKSSLSRTSFLFCFWFTDSTHNCAHKHEVNKHKDALPAVKKWVLI